MKWTKNYIPPFWDEEYKELNYRKEAFNGDDDLTKWRTQGYNQEESYFTGQMCPFGEYHPDWTNDIVGWVEANYNLRDIGVCFYKMETGVILPEHSDYYLNYKKKFGCKINQIQRVLVFLEDWKSGHYFEMDSVPIVNWRKGDCYVWSGKTKHMAANIGPEYRYTLQLTGWKK